MKQYKVAILGATGAVGREMMKVLTDGTNTIVTPETTPERLSGITTLKKVCVGVQPRSADASSRRLSSLESTV